MTGAFVWPDVSLFDDEDSSQLVSWLTRRHPTNTTSREAQPQLQVTAVAVRRTRTFEDGEPRVVVIDSPKRTQKTHRSCARGAELSADGGGLGCPCTAAPTLKSTPCAFGGSRLSAADAFGGCSNALTAKPSLTAKLSLLQQPGRQPRKCRRGGQGGGIIPSHVAGGSC